MKVIYSDFDGLARTNGRDIEINSKYKGTSSEKLFIYHEEGHILLDHFKRQKGREIDLWNVATDLEIAIYLYPLQDYKDQFGNTYGTLNEAIQKVPNLNGLIYWEDTEFKEMGISDFHIAEEIYEILKKKRDEENNEEENENGECQGQKSQKNKETIEKAAERSTKFHGSDEFKLPEEQEESRSNEEKISPDEEQEVLDKINDAIASCQLAKEVQVKKLKINHAITDSINKEGKGSLSFRKTYSRPCRSKVGLETDRLYRGERVVETKSEIFLFVDRSGSFDDEKTRAQEQAVKDLTKRYRGRLKVKTLYFTTDVFEDKESIIGCGTNAYSCLQYIERYRPSMSIIITDDDRTFSNAALDLKKSKVGFIFIGCDKNDSVTSLVTKFNGILVNKCN